MTIDSNTGIPTGGQSRGAIADFVNSSSGKDFLATQNSNSASTVNNNTSDIVSTANSDPLYGDLGNAQIYLDYLSGVTAKNSALSQANAREQMQFQRDQNALAMAFNALEAQKTRDWQSLMSNTSHQREVRDLVAAGLNPVLSANNGASTPSGATASGVTSSGAMGDVDTSLSGAVASLIGSVINAQTQLKSIDTNAKTNLEIAKINSETQRYLGDLSASASIYGSNMHYAGTKYSADSSRSASQYASDISKMIAQIQSATSISNAKLAQSTTYHTQMNDFINEWALKSSYPQSAGDVAGNIASFFGSLFGLNSGDMPDYMYD